MRSLLFIIFFVISIVALPTFKTQGDNRYNKVNSEKQEEQQKKTNRSKNIELVNALTMEFDKKIGHDARRLIGEVIFKHNDIQMHCDSAYMYSANNSLKAFSNVHIKASDTLNIYGDELYYNGNTSIAEIRGNVKMKDKQMTLTTEHLTYDFNANIAKYYDGGKIIDLNNELTSQLGFYYADIKHFHFKDDVKLVNPEYTMESDTLKYNTLNEISYFFGPTKIVSDENIIYCKNGWYDTKNDIAQFNREAFIHNQEQSITGDSLFYDRNKGYGKALNNVAITDTVQNIIINGHFGEHFEKDGLSVITNEALLTIISANDSLFLHADTLKYISQNKTDTLNENLLQDVKPETVITQQKENNPVDKKRNRKTVETRKILAYNKGKFYRTNLQGLSDSIVYNFNDSIIYMYHEPILWSEENQLTAEHIEIDTWNNTVKAARLINAAFIISQEDTLNFNQIKGRKIIGHFNNNELYKIHVFDNGETIYYVKDEKEQLIGINKAISSNMIIYVEQNQVKRIIFLDNPEANLYPPKSLSQEERLLRHFDWYHKIRPKSKEDIFTWN